MLSLRAISFLFISALLTYCSPKKEGSQLVLKVYGNCEMCKETIESSLKDEKAVFAADWNKDTKMMTLSFDSTRIKESDIHKKIASVGYDTEIERGSDDAYQNLHKCCQYNRRK